MYKEFFLKVSEKHLIYVRVQGNEKGVPVLLFHGGPGDSSGDSCLDYFDREKFLLIQFDQRGAGKSKVLGEDILFDNNSEALAADAKEILRFLAVDRAVFYGASWGSTLALYTACRYPELCRGLFLRAVFLADEEQMSWTYERGGAEKIYPDAFSEFKQFLDEYRQGDERNLQVMLRLMDEGDDECRKKLCRVINGYELKLLAPIDLPEYWSREENKEIEERENSVDPECVEFTIGSEDTLLNEEGQFLPVYALFDEGGKDIGIARVDVYDFDESTCRQVKIALHYAKNSYFIEGASILEMIEDLPGGKREYLKSLPCEIVHGRIDMLCPLYAAFDLKEVLDGADLTVLPYASHYPVAEFDGNIMREKSEKLFGEISD